MPQDPQNIDLSAFNEVIDVPVVVKKENGIDLSPFDEVVKKKPTSSASQTGGSGSKNGSKTSPNTDGGLTANEIEPELKAFGLPTMPESEIASTTEARLPTNEELKTITPEFNKNIFVTPEKMPEHLGEAVSNKLNEINTALDTMPLPTGELGKLVTKSFIGSMASTVEGARKISEIDVNNDPSAILQLPAALAQTAFGATGTVLPQLMAFNTAIEGVKEVLPKEYVETIMSPLSTMVNNQAFVIPVSPGADPMNPGGEPMIKTVSHASKGVQAAAELGDLAWNILLFKGMHELAGKVKNNIPLTPIERDEVAKAIDEGIKDYRAPFKASTLDKIPDGIGTNKILEVAPLVEQRDALEKEKEKLSAAFKPLQDEKIKKLDEQIQSTIFTDLPQKKEESGIQTDLPKVETERKTENGVTTELPKRAEPELSDAEHVTTENIEFDLPNQKPKNDAAQKRIISKNDQQEHLGISSGENLPADESQIRSENREQTGGSSSTLGSGEIKEEKKPLIDQLDLSELDKVAPREEPVVEQTEVPKPEAVVEQPKTKHELAKDVANEIGGTVVGSAAKEGTNPRDIDIRVDEYNQEAIEKKMADLRYEFRGSSIITPKEAKSSRKKYSDGWQRAQHFENKEGDKIDIWHDEPATTEQVQVEAENPQVEVKTDIPEVKPQEPIVEGTEVPTEDAAATRRQEILKGIAESKAKIAKLKNDVNTLGVVKLPEIEAQRLYDLHKAYVKIAKQYIELGGENIKELSDAILKKSGYVMKKVLDSAWSVAKGIKEDFKDFDNFKNEFDERTANVIEPPAPAENVTAATGERKFTQRLLDDENIELEAKYEIIDDLEYIRQTNAMTIKESQAVIRKVGLEEAYNMIVNDPDIKPAVRVVMGQTIIKSFNELAKDAPDAATKKYYIEKTVDAANFVADKLGTEAGRMVQAFSLFQQLSPEANIVNANRQLRKSAKAKVEERTTKKSIRKVSEKFKQANEESAKEVTEDKSVTEATKKSESARTKKAKGNIEKARQKRADAIKEWRKSLRDRASSSIIGFTDSDIKAIKAITESYIEEGIADIQIIADKITDILKHHVPEISPDTRKEIEKLADKELNKADFKTVGKALRKQDVKVADVVRKHFTVAEAVKRDLVTKLIEDAGLADQDAVDLAAKVQSAFDRIATRKKKALLEAEQQRFEQLQKKLTGKKGDPKGLQDELIRLTNLGAFTDEQFSQFLIDKLKIGKLNPEEAQEIIRLSNKIQEAPTGSPKRDATEDLLNYMANLKGTSWGEVGQAVWYAQIMSGYATHLKNIVSTFFNSMSFLGVEAIKDPLAIPYLLTGFGKGVGVRGTVEAAHTFKTGRSPIHISKLEASNVLERTQFKGGFLNPYNYMKYVMRAMVAEDVLQFQGLKEARAYQLAVREARKQGFKGLKIHSKAAWAKVNEILLNTPERLAEATEQAKTEGLTGIAAKRRIWELMEQNREQEMVDESYGFAAHGTFNHETEGSLGALTDAFSQALDVPVGGVKPFRFLVPFTRIITNVANNALDYTPVGAIRAARGVRGFQSFESRPLLGGKYKELTPEERKTLLVKSALGISIATALGALSNENSNIQITGYGTGDPRKDSQLRQSGWQQFSLKIGGKYFGYKYTPLVFALAPVGFLKDHEKYGKTADDETALQKAALMASQSARLLADMTWIGSTSSMLGAFAEPNLVQAEYAAQSAFNKSVTGFAIPNAYTQLAEEYEQIMRMPKKDTQNLYGKLIEHIPIARNSLNNKLNALGDPITTQFDIFQTDETDDPRWKYLLDNKLWVAPPSQKATLIFDSAIKQDRPLTDDEYYEFIQLRGRKIKAGLDVLMQEKKISQTEKAKLLSTIKDDATSKAKEDLFAPKTETELTSREEDALDAEDEIKDKIFEAMDAVAK